jgi:hypothetical protein
MQIWKENVSIYCRIITQGGWAGGGGGDRGKGVEDPCLIIHSQNFQHDPIPSPSSLDLLEGKHIFPLS